MATKSIYDLYNSKSLAIYWNTLTSNSIPYLGEALFPSKKKMGLKLEWIKGVNQLPIALMPSAFDAKATLRDRIGAYDVATKMPFFRESMRIGEEDRQQLMMLIEANSNGYVDQIIGNIFNDISNLIEGARVQTERMRMQLLAYGAITIGAPDDSGVVVDYNYNYDPSGTWASANTDELTSTHCWDAPTTASPVQDIINIRKTMQTTYGVDITRAICTTKTWGYMLACSEIKNDMMAANGITPIIDDVMLKDYLKRKTGVTFAIYDKQYKDQDGSSYQYYPDDYVTFLPSNSLGNTYYGTTPEEADLMSGQSDGASVSVVDTGIAVMTKKESHPVNIMSIVSMIALPSYERMNDVYTLKVT